MTLFQSSVCSLVPFIPPKFCHAHPPRESPKPSQRERGLVQWPGLFLLRQLRLQRAGRVVRKLLVNEVWGGSLRSGIFWENGVASSWVNIGTGRIKPQNRSVDTTNPDMRSCVCVTHMLSHTGLKYGICAVNLKSIETVLESGFFSRSSSWRNSTVGGHPWQVSVIKTLIS